MEVFLGVTNRTAPLSLRAGDESFWCVHVTYEAQPGDLILLHKTVYGIAQIYQISSEPYADGRFQCTVRDMLTVDTILLANLDRPVSVAEMKADPVLREWGAVRRNFQKTIFRMNSVEWGALRTLIIEKNPTLRDTIAEGSLELD